VRCWPALEEALWQEADLVRPPARGGVTAGWHPPESPRGFSGEPPDGTPCPGLARMTAKGGGKAVRAVHINLTWCLNAIDLLWLAVSQGRDMLASAPGEALERQARWTACFFHWLYEGVGLGHAGLQKHGHRFAAARASLQRDGAALEFKWGRARYASAHHAALEAAEQLLGDLWKIAEPGRSYKPFPQLPPFDRQTFAAGCTLLYSHARLSTSWASLASSSRLEAGCDQEWSVVEAQLQADEQTAAQQIARAAQQAPAGTPAVVAPPTEAPEFLPTAEDITILTVLAEAGRALLNADIVNRAAAMHREKRQARQQTSLVLVSESTLAARIPLLLTAGLVARPLKPSGEQTARKGVGITRKGRDLLQSAAG
jgi:hypothetical protein